MKRRERLERMSKQSGDQYTVEQIAAWMGVTTSAIYGKIRRLGLKRRWRIWLFTEDEMLQIMKPGRHGRRPEEKE